MLCKAIYIDLDKKIVLYPIKGLSQLYENDFQKSHWKVKCVYSQFPNIVWSFRYCLGFWKYECY